MSGQSMGLVGKWICKVAAPAVVLAGSTIFAETPPAKRDASIGGSHVVAGQEREMGRGRVRSWVQLNAEGAPTAVGVTFDESCLTDLPKDGGRTCCDGPQYAMQLPGGIPGSPFKEAVINWNPKGHEPAGIYDKPHFDFHFYFMSADRREKITACDTDLVRATRPLPALETPAGYVMAPGAVPRMGAHWADTASPEFNGHPFTQTLVYGSYDGKLTFIEPMITLAYLQSKPDLVAPMKKPARYPASGAYPTSYRVSYDSASKRYTVALEGLTPREAAGPVQLPGLVGGKPGK